MSVQIPSAVVGPSHLEVSERVFGTPYNESLVHQIVVAYLAKGRSGTKAQKSRSDVRGGGAKPWRQKGTGRARAGTSRSPIWRTGGVTFAARNRDYTQKVNRKMYRGAMRCIFSELLRQDRLFFATDPYLPEPKTKVLLSKLGEIGVQEGGVFVTEQDNTNLFLAARNLTTLKVCGTRAINPVLLINSKKVVMTVDAIKRIEGLLI